MDWLYKRRAIILWQVLFLLLSTSWLFAPQLNHFLSTRTSLISQYETASQPFSIYMRLADFSGGLLLVAMASFYLRRLKAKTVGLLMLLTGIGLAVDPIFTTTCKVIATQCTEFFSLNFLMHAAETVMTALAFFGLVVYDAWTRKRVLSIMFAGLQIAYFGLFLTQYATHAHFNTITQFAYQLAIVVWLTWFCRDYMSDKIRTPLAPNRGQVVKLLIAGWAFANGIIAIVISLKDLNLYGKLHGFYFAGDNAWLAQHGVVVGVILLYLSRHLARGERRARQIFLLITGVEVLKFSVITPHWPLLMFYMFSFCLLFVWRDEFDRGTQPLTWNIRARDLYFMVASLMFAALVSLIMLDRDNRVAIVSNRAIDHFFDYVFNPALAPKTHLQSVLLAHTITAFIVASAAAILWIIFKPNRVPAPLADSQSVREHLLKYSNSSEDFFKLWPEDKNYFWDKAGQCFIAYRLAGPVIFALADPIGPPSAKHRCLREFISWARSQRLRVCLLPVFSQSSRLYKRAGLSQIQIGSSALINVDDFITNTANDKWWRWQKNRAGKAGYIYQVSSPPHSKQLLTDLKAVSDAWLTKGGHAERGFALGYFAEDFLQQCNVHYLTDESGQIIAFTNQIPVFKEGTATIDMLRYLPDASGAMPFLLFKTIESVQQNQTDKYFDLGFVPFAAVSNPALQVAKALSSGRFSAAGLEQFKNKFDPTWEPNYLAYDGDLADLALIAINLEKAMEV